VVTDLWCFRRACSWFWRGRLQCQPNFTGTGKSFSWSSYI